MKRAFSTLACPEWSLAQIIQAAGRWGYAGIELRGLCGELAMWKRAELSTQQAQTRSMLRDAGVEICCLSSSATMFCADAQAEQAAMEEVVRYAGIAASLGVKFIRVFGGRIGQTPWDTAISRSVDCLTRLSAAVEESGVTLAVETHDDWVASRRLAEVVGRVGKPNVGLLWDVHHPLQLGGEPLEETLRNLGQLTVYTHVKDSRKLPSGEVEYCLPGEGEVPLEKIVRMLRGAGYDGYIALEWEKFWHPELPGPEVALPAYAAALQRAIEAAR